MTYLSSLLNATLWNNVARSGSFAASDGDINLVNTTSGAITATLPASPQPGDAVEFVDAYGMFATNALTLNRNGSNINGVANNIDCDINYKRYLATYVDATVGWSVTY